MNDNEIFQKLTELKDQGIVAGLATIIETVGSTPREAGAKMIICADGTLYGSVGGGCGESEVRSAALRSILTSQKPELLEIDLTDDIGTRDGDVCGGKMRIFVEPMVS
ncbi:MAG: XdhC family protein [Desulfobacterales bacterium]|jgi:xanthine dehydrogenase accessory factor|nr:XdhC family protein [Desulfobacterales bacterium]